MKTAISLYSYDAILGRDGWNLKRCLEHAKSCGFEGIEILYLDYYRRPGIWPEYLSLDAELMDYAKFLKKLSTELDLPIIAYDTEARLDDYEFAKWSSDLERLKAELDLAQYLGATVVRVDLVKTWRVVREDRNACFKALHELLTPLIAYAEDLGLTLVVENHGEVFNERYHLMKLLEENPGLGLLLDNGNFVKYNLDIPEDIAAFAPWIKHVHLKDLHVVPRDQLQPGRGWAPTFAGTYLRGAILGQGNFDLISTVQFLQQIAYEGYLSLEYSGLENPLTAVECSAEYIKQLMKV